MTAHTVESSPDMLRVVKMPAGGGSMGQSVFDEYETMLGRFHWVVSSRTTAKSLFAYRGKCRKLALEDYFGQVPFNVSKRMTLQTGWR